MAVAVKFMCKLICPNLYADSFLKLCCLKRINFVQSINQSINDFNGIAAYTLHLTSQSNVPTLIFKNSKNTRYGSYMYVLRQYGMKQLRNLVVRVRSL